MRAKSVIRVFLLCGMLLYITSCLFKNNNYSWYDPHTNIRNTTNDGHLIRRAIKKESRQIDNSLKKWSEIEFIHDTIFAINLEKVLCSPIDSFFAFGGACCYEKFYEQMNYPPRRGGILDYYMYRVSFFYNGEIIYEENLHEKYSPFFHNDNGRDSGPYYSNMLYVRRRHYNKKYRIHHRGETPYSNYFFVSNTKLMLDRKLFSDEDDRGQK